MSARPAVVLGLFAALLGIHAEPASAQADVHARALARASCQAGKQTDTVTSATAALARDPGDLPPRMRLADALVDQGCYQEAVTVLEAGQQAHPRNNELAAKLRDVRSLVTEQTYIEGLTQAAEGAKFQRNQLRCMRLADVTACDDALQSKPDDPQLLAAKHDALAKQAALVASEMPPQERAPPVAAQIATTATPRSKPKRPPASVPPAPATPTAAPLPILAALQPPEIKNYSNEAPPGHSN
jgi:hypothetical protein